MLDRRFQILLDEERYQRVMSSARERHVSAATVIREAIDRGVPPSPRRRAAALRTILEAELMEVPDPAELKRELDELRAGGL